MDNTNPPVAPPTDAPKEPVLSRTLMVLVGQLAVGAGGIFGLNLDPVLVSAIVAALGPVVLGLLARAAAWAPQSVAQLVEDVRLQLTQGGAPPAGLGDLSGGTGTVNTNPGDHDATTTNLRYPDNTNPGSTS